jgi:hypothetical protein
MFPTLAASDVRRLKALEAENARLKKLVAERDLEIEASRSACASTTGCPPSSGLRITRAGLARKTPLRRGAGVGGWRKVRAARQHRPSVETSMKCSGSR